MSKLDLPLEVLVPCHDTAAWRRQKAEQYPGDDRNLKAAEALDTLGAQLEALEESPLHDRLHDFYLNNPEFNFNEHVSATLREAGFHYQPAEGPIFLEELIASLEEAALSAAEEAAE